MLETKFPRFNDKIYNNHLTLFLIFIQKEQTYYKQSILVYF